MMHIQSTTHLWAKREPHAEQVYATLRSGVDQVKNYCIASNAPQPVAQFKPVLHSVYAMSENRLHVQKAILVAIANNT